MDSSSDISPLKTLAHFNQSKASETKMIDKDRQQNLEQEDPKKEKNDQKKDSVELSDQAKNELNVQDGLFSKLELANQLKNDIGDNPGENIDIIV